MGCCGGRTRTIVFEINFKINPKNPENRKIEVLVMTPKNEEDPNILSLFEEKIRRMSIRQEVKKFLLRNDFLFNGQPIKSTSMTKENLKKLNTVTIPEVVPIDDLPK